MQSELYTQLYEYLDTISIIDTHEHLSRYEALRDKGGDVLAEYISHYFKYDLFSAGLSEEDYQKAIDCSISLHDRWNLLEPYWEACRHTGYGRHLDVTAQALYGIERIDASTLKALQQAFSMQKDKPAYLQEIFAKGHIETCLLDTDDWLINCDTTYAQGVCRVDSLIVPRTWADIQRMETFTGISICDFNTYLLAMESIIEKAVGNGAKAFKLGLAYYRSLSFERTGLSEAQEAFKSLFITRHYPRWKEKPIMLGQAAQDYLLHHLLSIANKHKHVYQIHTGLQAGNANYLANSNPLRLSNLCIEYPNVTFCLLHLGFPFQIEVCVMAKTFVNVYLDMAWNHLISPSESIRFLQTSLDLVPLNKLFAFGGDESKPDLVYGHLVMAKQHTALAFSALVESGRIDMNEAKAICLQLFYTNPKRVYKL